MAPIGLQYTWSYSQDNGVKLGGSLDTATCQNGILGFGGAYFEVYKNDIDNSDTGIQESISAIKSPWLCF